MYVRLPSYFQEPRRGVGRVITMETIWLQRPGPEVPWGFRLQGGREFGLPLSVQRVSKNIFLKF